MKDTEAWKKENGDKEMRRDSRKTPNDSKAVNSHITQNAGEATKAKNACSDRSRISDSSITTNKMPGHIECKAPQRESREDYEPRSAESTLYASSETLDDQFESQEVRPSPCQVSRTLSGETIWEPQELSGKVAWEPPPLSRDINGEPLPLSRDISLASTEKDDDLITIPACMSNDEVEILQTAPPQPPVTKESLEELELTYIQSNVTLRIDINFDHDLHFTPISGDKGEQKKQDARRYWHSLEIELRIVYLLNSIESDADGNAKRSRSSGQQVPRQLKRFKRRLPLLFQKLKELLVILVPERDQYQINENLDVSLLLQEASHGLLDIVRLARWLDGLLTSHCAPMRDMSAQEMAEKIRKGAENGDVETLVAGIEMLFQILEAMKLDVANHQIRSFRYILIDDTVPFQQEFFRSRIRRGSLDAGASRTWYQHGHEKHQQCQVDRQTPRSFPLAVLVHGMLEICLWHGLKLPATLAYDQKRLKEIRVDIQDFVHLDICLAMFNVLLHDLTVSLSNGVPIHRVSGRQVMDMQTLRNRIMDITDGNPDEVPQIWLQYAEAIAVELNRTALLTLGVATESISAEKVAQTTRRLIRMFEHEHQHQTRARQVAQEIEQEAHKHASRFQNMTVLQISHELKSWQQVRAQRYRWRLLPEMEDIARRLAHIASVHWRVWADLVYLESAEHESGISGIDSISGDGFLITTVGPMDYVQCGFGDDTPCR